MHVRFSKVSSKRVGEYAIVPSALLGSCHPDVEKLEPLSLKLEKHAVAQSSFGAVAAAATASACEALSCCSLSAGCVVSVGSARGLS